MDYGTIIAVVGCTVAIVGTTITMMLWMRGESRNDWRNLQGQIIDDRREFIQIIRNIELEMKDFHHRLLEIERSRRL